jgi:hypothetical protein
MSDHPRLRVLCEGHTFHALLLKMERAGLLPRDIELDRPDQHHSGKDRLAPKAATAFAGGLRRLVVIHDRDDQRPLDVAAGFVRTVDDRGAALGAPQPLPGRDDAFLAHDGSARRLAVVTVGLTQLDALTGGPGLTCGAIDDYVLRMALDRATWDARKELKRACHHATFTKKVVEVAALLRQNGLTVDSTKQLLPTIRLVTAFGAAPATQTSDLWDSAATAHGPAVTRFAEPLAGAIHAAALALRA